MAPTGSPCPHPVRHHSELNTFAKENPCPGTHKPITHCAGYVIDHVFPLCACGKDAPANMQWQLEDAAKRKDEFERELCEGKISKAQYEADTVGLRP
jgi:hypothetical protein